jgi:hypothetical protein
MQFKALQFIQLISTLLLISDLVLIRRMRCPLFGQLESVILVRSAKLRRFEFIVSIFARPDRLVLTRSQSLCQRAE